MRAGEAELPTPTREILQNAVDLGYAKRFNPWDHYVLPLLKLTPGILEKNPEATLRVNLAKDLEFLSADLVAVGCEVYLMKSSSINFAPGGLWRFLPFSEEGKQVTVTDIDRLNEIESDLVRTRIMAQSGLGAWRVPVPTDLTGDFRVCYLPFMGCQFGVRGGIFDVRELLEAFTWQCLRDAVNYQVIFPNCGPLPIQAHTWPSYGFDEFFMNVAAYPRLAQHGMHTYFATALSVLGRSPLQRVANRPVTWTDWAAGGSHPKEFSDVSPELAARIAESGCFFARKFTIGSDIRDFGLHRDEAAGLVR